MFSSVETTVVCSVVVPTRVIATGVSARPASIRAPAISAMVPDGGEQHQRAVVGVPAPVDLVAAGDDGDLAVSLVVSGMPA